MLSQLHPRIHLIQGKDPAYGGSDVIEDEAHFIKKVVNNDLRALTMVTKHFMSEHKKGVIRSYRQKSRWRSFVVLGGRSSRESKNACGEVNRGSDDFGVSKSLLGEIPGVVIGESGGETFGDDEGAVW
ncbi:hypothetical protein Tco_0572901 [Tanacetum coccineum]